MPSHKPKPPLALILMGPTAVGKSYLALELAKRLPLEIVSVDSAMVYRGMDIGTSKPSAVELKAVPHHLIDLCDPSESYSAARFVEDALKAMQDISQRGRIPLLVGGTMFYFLALIQGLSPLPSADLALRDALSAEAEALGWPALHQRLERINPKAAARIHPHDGQRIQRALEIDTLTKCHSTPLGPGGEGKTSLDNYQVLSFARLQPNRRLLHQTIADRFQAMLDQGLVAEVQSLWCRPDLKPSMPSMRAVGYRQIMGYLAENYDYQTMVQKSIAATRQLAKRQIGWMRQFPGLIPLEDTHLASLQTMLDFLPEDY